jgi:hypothetical protein
MKGMPERAVFDYGILEIIKKWEEMNRSDINLNLRRSK